MLPEALLLQSYDMREKTGCIIMASGMGSRFGSNKLIAEFGGKPVIEYVLDTATEFSENFGTDLAVLTRWSEVADIAERRGMTCVRHSLTRKSDVIRLGIEHAVNSGWDACIFILGDQPLLKQESIGRLYSMYCSFGGSGKVFRLGADGVPGSPVIFSSCHYDALRTLSGEQGGMSLYGPDDTVTVPPCDPYEMLDIDTAEDLDRVNNIWQRTAQDA